MSIFGYCNPREQVGYITIGLVSHCVLMGRGIETVKDSLCTLIDPQYRGVTAPRDLLFQSYQEWDCLTRVLQRNALTVEGLLGLLVAGRADWFFRELAHQAVKDANYRSCRIPPCVKGWGWRYNL